MKFRAPRRRREYQPKRKVQPPDHSKLAPLYAHLNEATRAVSSRLLTRMRTAAEHLNGAVKE